MTTPLLTFTNGTVPIKTREVALLGYAEETRELIDTVSPYVEIWGINAAHYFLKRPAAYWFQLHPRGWSSAGGKPTGYFGRPKEHMDWLQKFEGTLWVMKPDRDLPNARVFPLAGVRDLVGREYLTSTFAYQLALALYEHMDGHPISKLHLYGINLTAMEEYAHQRPCAEYWLGRLEQAGVEVIIPTKSALLKGQTYPEMGGSDLARHAYERLQHWKGNYMAHWANTNTAIAMQLETKHWADFLNKLAGQHPDKFTEDVMKAIQAHITERDDRLNALSNRYYADFNGAVGVVKDCQHFLTMLGGQDFKAPVLPELRVPNELLAGDLNPVKQPERI